MFPFHNRVMHKCLPVKIFPVHIHRRDLMIFIRRVVIDSFCCIAAGSIQRNFIFAICHLTTSALLVNRT